MDGKVYATHMIEHNPEEEEEKNFVDGEVTIKLGLNDSSLFPYVDANQIVGIYLKRPTIKQNLGFRDGCMKHAFGYNQNPKSCPGGFFYATTYRQWSWQGEKICRMHERFQEYRCNPGFPYTKDVNSYMRVEETGDGGWMAIRPLNWRSKYWCADEKKKIKCNREWRKDWERFDFADASMEGFNALKGANKNRFCATETKGRIACNRKDILDWERMQFKCAVNMDLGEPSDGFCHKDDKSGRSDACHSMRYLMQTEELEDRQTYCRVAEDNQIKCDVNLKGPIDDTALFRFHEVDNKYDVYNMKYGGCNIKQGRLKCDDNGVTGMYIFQSSRWRGNDYGPRYYNMFRGIGDRGMQCTGHASDVSCNGDHSSGKSNFLFTCYRPPLTDWVEITAKKDGKVVEQFTERLIEHGVNDMHQIMFHNIVEADEITVKGSNHGHWTSKFKLSLIAVNPLARVPSLERTVPTRPIRTGHNYWLRSLCNADAAELMRADWNSGNLINERNIHVKQALAAFFRVAEYFKWVFNNDGDEAPGATVQTYEFDDPLTKSVEQPYRQNIKRVYCEGTMTPCADMERYFQSITGRRRLLSTSSQKRDAEESTKARNVASAPFSSSFSSSSLGNHNTKANWNSAGNPADPYLHCYRDEGVNHIHAGDDKVPGVDDVKKPRRHQKGERRVLVVRREEASKHQARDRVRFHI